MSFIGLFSFPFPLCSLSYCCCFWWCGFCDVILGLQKHPLWCLYFFLILAVVLTKFHTSGFMLACNKVLIELCTFFSLRWQCLCMCLPRVTVTHLCIHQMLHFLAVLFVPCFSFALWGSSLFLWCFYIYTKFWNREKYLALLEVVDNRVARLKEHNCQEHACMCFMLGN